MQLTNDVKPVLTSLFIILNQLFDGLIGENILKQFINRFKINALILIFDIRFFKNGFK